MPTPTSWHWVWSSLEHLGEPMVLGISTIVEFLVLGS